MGAVGAFDPKYAVPIQHSACRLTPKAAGQPRKYGGSAMRPSFGHSMQLAVIFLADIDAEGGVQSDQMAGAIRFLICAIRIRRPFEASRGLVSDRRYPTHLSVSAIRHNNRHIFRYEP